MKTYLRSGEVGDLITKEVLNHVLFQRARKACIDPFSQRVSTIFVECVNFNKFCGTSDNTSSFKLDLY